MTDNTDPSTFELLRGQTVKCQKCKCGVYRPVNPDAVKNHYFVCDNCGTTVHFEPIVEVD